VPLGSASLPFFGSLSDMLFWLGFTRVRMRALPEQTVQLFAPRDHAGAAAGAPAPERMAGVLAELGFEALAVTGPDARLFERGDRAAALYRAPLDRAALADTANALQRAFPRPADRP